MTGALGTTAARQRGAALIIVLLLVATLSFILLSITNIVTSGVRRASAERARSELLWAAAAAEKITQSILKTYLATAPSRMAAGEGLFAQQLELPFDGGVASLIFEDATRCFNVNGLVTGSAGNFVADPARMESFVGLVESIGVGSGEARKLSEVITDFIDSDGNTQGQGAEDGFYTALPVPYRTSGGLIASLTELRAMDGVSREVYLRIRPFLCALDRTEQPAINLNLVQEVHAPLLKALLGAGSDASMDDIRAAIAAIPPGGAGDPSSLPSPLSEIPAGAVKSSLIRARVRLEFNGRAMEETLLFEAETAADGKAPRLLARAFGDEF